MFMVYLTFGNQSNGVFASYVTEVCKYLNSEFKTNIRIVSFVSIRNFRVIRRERKQMYPNSIILPMFPKMENWKINIITLAIVWPFVGKKNVIALSPIAANLALKLKRIKLVDKLIYDAEGATSAEWNEYNVVDNNLLKRAIYGIEENAVMKSDFRRTVSTKMIDYWKDSFCYSGHKHVVIPCSLNSIFMKPLSSSEKIKQQRELFGYSEDDVVIVYSGSSAQWQSFDMIADFLDKLFSTNKCLRLLMLTDAKPDNIFIDKYSHRISVKWVDYDKVPDLLKICDYGILMRENTITNKVAAPTKFAEYLSSGLKVLISPRVGDYSDFVQKYDCGIIVQGDDFAKMSLSQVDYKTKIRLNELAINQFSKKNYKKEFEQMLTIFGR